MQYPDASVEDAERRRRRRGSPDTPLEVDSDAETDPFDDSSFDGSDESETELVFQPPPRVARSPSPPVVSPSVLPGVPVHPSSHTSVPHSVYVLLARQSDTLFGRDSEVRALVDSLVGGAPAPSPSSGLGVRLQSLVDVTDRGLRGLETFADRDRGFDEIIRMVRFLLTRIARTLAGEGSTADD